MIKLFLTLWKVQNNYTEFEKCIFTNNFHTCLFVTNKFVIFLFFSGLVINDFINAKLKFSYSIGLYL